MRDTNDNSETKAVAKIQLVGHCFADRMWLKSSLKRMPQLAGVTRIEAVNSTKEMSPSDSLLVINRVLDGRFDFHGEDSGIALISKLVAEDAGVRCVLVSNYATAQAEAVEVGAYPGFGKSEVGEAEMVARLVRAVGG